MPADPHDHASHSSHASHEPASHDHAGHNHAHHGHDHDHSHGHDHGPVIGKPRVTSYIIAAFIILVAVAAAMLGIVRQGSAVVVTRFGDPVRIELEPGLIWKWPAPIERTVEVDLRLHTTATGFNDVGSKDGLRVVMQAFVAWRVPADPVHIRRFLGAVRNRPDEAANQLRTFLGSSLETVAARFELTSLLNTDPSQVRIAEFEQALADIVNRQVLDTYGIDVRQVGLERLSLPKATIGATVGRMIAERQTVAEEKKAYGRRVAGEIRSAADKEARIVRAKADEDASVIEASARTEAAAIYGKVHAADPTLYAFLRGLDTLDQAIQPGTKLVLRTDAAPFRALVENPTEHAGPAPADAPPGGSK